MANITIIGGGLAGLTAAIAAAEQGARVTLHEAHSHLGGRARSADGPYVTNDGPHTIMNNGPAWQWLIQRGVAGRYVRLSFHEWTRMRFRHQGKLRMTLPPGYMKMTLLKRDRPVPIDRSFQDWASENFPSRRSTRPSASSARSSSTATRADCPPPSSGSGCCGSARPSSPCPAATSSAAGGRSSSAWPASPATTGWSSRPTPA